VISPSDDIYAILIQKRKAFDEFESITGLLRHALESEDLTAVNRFIERRDELIPIIDEIDCHIRGYRQKDQPDQGPVLDQGMTEMSERFYERLMQIISINQECNAIAASLCDVLKKKMATVHKNEEGLHVYAAKTQGIPKFLNIHT
jgi:hypothetical protein